MKELLLTIDPKLRQFAGELGAVIITDDTRGQLLPQGFESRSIRWQQDGMQCSVSIYPTIENNQARKWNLGVFITEATGKHVTKVIAAQTTKKYILHHIDGLLEQALLFIETKIAR